LLSDNPLKNKIMTTDKLKELNELSSKIKSLEKTIENGKTQTCEWIEFTFGNGSNRSNVCDDKDLISLVRDLIVSENTKRLETLQEQFKSL